MNNGRRMPRKLIRVKEAAAILQESRTSVKNRIARHELQVVPGRGKTSPLRVFEAEVIAIARQMGIL